MRFSGGGPDIAGRLHPAMGASAGPQSRERAGRAPRPRSRPVSSRCSCPASRSRSPGGNVGIVANRVDEPSTLGQPTQNTLDLGLDAFHARATGPPRSPLSTSPIAAIAPGSGGVHRPGCGHREGETAACITDVAARPAHRADRTTRHRRAPWHSGARPMPSAARHPRSAASLIAASQSLTT